MGKHERQKIKKAEEIIVKILWFEHAQAIAKQIKIDLPTLRKARHLGNRYDLERLLLGNSRNQILNQSIKLPDRLNVDAFFGRMRVFNCRTNRNRL